MAEPGRADAAGRGQRPARLAVVAAARRRRISGSNPSAACNYQRRGADAAVPDRLASNAPAEHADRRRRATNEPQLLGNLADDRARRQPDEHHPLQHHPDLRRAGERPGAGPGLGLARIEQIVESVATQERRRHDYLPAGTTISLRGQVESMNSSFRGLALGHHLRGRAGLPADGGQLPVVAGPADHPEALPGAAAGILWMLFATRTTISVPALMGSIMCIGVATANSILMITFANDQRKTVGTKANRDAG